MPSIQIKYSDSYHNLQLPLIQTPRAGDVGYDVYCTTNVLISPQSIARIPLGFSIALPDGYFALLLTRSSMSVMGVTVTGGVIDNGNRGMLSVVLSNNSQVAHRFTLGDRIAQMVLFPMAVFPLESVDVLPPSLRGEGGFGSTSK